MDTSKQSMKQGTSWEPDSRLGNQFHAFYRTWNTIIIYTKVRQWILPWASWTHTFITYLSKIKFNMFSSAPLNSTSPFEVSRLKFRVYKHHPQCVMTESCSHVGNTDTNLTARHAFCMSRVTSCTEQQHSTWLSSYSDGLTTSRPPTQSPAGQHIDFEPVHSLALLKIPLTFASGSRAHCIEVQA
jgi:hypothetical protein